MSIAVNPPASRLGVENAILWGRGRKQYHVREFPGPLSIKAVKRGTVEWRVGKSRFELDANSYLVLNHGQPYAITVESAAPVETFCMFFARGFAEDASRSLTAAGTALLDDPERATSVGFYERLRPRDARVRGVLDEIHRCLAGGESDQIEPLIYKLALGLCGLREELAQEIGRVPALRASTREELHRRVHLGKQALDEMFDTRLPLAQIARLAHLSPFHFHRAFSSVLGETPHGYRTRRRLEKAARLLSETELPVTDVCLDTGFESLPSFATLFRKRYYASPIAFRKFARSDRRAVGG